MKSELAKARDEWLNSEEGKRCCEGTPTGQYLQNRLERAFLAGAKYSDSVFKYVMELREEIKDLTAENKLQKEVIRIDVQMFEAIRDEYPKTKDLQAKIV